jgi:hypothetical protein
MKRLKALPRTPKREQRQMITEEECIRRLKTIKQWREKKLAEFRRTGRVPHSTRTD